MGLFSSSKETTVGTSVSRVLKDEDIPPNSVTVGTLQAIFQDGDIASHILEELISNIGVKAERMYRYAANHYSYGLPSGTTYSGVHGLDEVEALLASIEGGPVLVEYARFGSINNYHAAWMQLIADHGYNPDTNSFSALSTQIGHTVYLESFKVVIPQEIFDTLGSSNLEQWGTSSTAGYTPERAAQDEALAAIRKPDKVMVSSTAVSEHIIVTYTWTEPLFAPAHLYPEGLGRYKQGTFTLPLDQYDGESDFFHVKYSVNGQTKYWLYEMDTGVHPVLEELYDTPPEAIGTYFPFAYFRLAKKSMELKEGTAEYNTSKKLVKYLGINYAEMIEAVHDNPDIKDVEQAMMIFAVPPETDDPIEARYLFDYFRSQYYLQNTSQHSQAYSGPMEFFRATRAHNKNTTIIADSSFRMTLGNDGIYRRMVFGSIGQVGVHTADTYRKAKSYEVINYESGLPEERGYEVSMHRYRHQVDDSLYEEIVVERMRLVYRVFGKYVTVGDETGDKVEKKILLVPIDRAITTNYSLPVRERLYFRSLHYVFNSRVVTKVKWYQSGFFSFLITAIAFVIAVFTFQPQLAAWGASMAAAGWSLKALVMTLAMNLIKQVVVQLAIKLFVKIVGAEFAFLAAVIGFLAAGYFKLTGGIEGAPWVDTLLQVATGITQGISDVMAEAMNDLMIEAEQFGLYAEEKIELLDSTRKLLEGNNLLSPFVIFGESPNDYYNRTVHSGNIGILGISAISNYVDIALALPTFSNTIGDNNANDRLS